MEIIEDSDDIIFGQETAIQKIFKMTLQELFKKNLRWDEILLEISTLAQDLHDKDTSLSKVWSDFSETNISLLIRRERK
jgi:hypothetical protein